MKCKQVENNLIGFIEGQLPLDLQSDISVHMIHCADCRAIYDQVKATWLPYSGLAIPELSHYFYSKLQQKIIDKSQKKIYISERMTTLLQPVAACILIFLAIFIGITIGSHITNVRTSANATNENDVLNTYATEYYFVNSKDVSLDNLLLNDN